VRIFRYAEDYYGGQLAQQILWPAVVLFHLLILLFIGIHLLRRSQGHPVRASAVPEGGLKYQPGARLYHWGNAVLIFVLIVSGAALLVPGSLEPRVLTWLRTHEIFAAAFVLGLIAHMIVAPRSGEGRSMWFERRDWADVRLIIASFFGRTRHYPETGKYDPFQKLYHALLAVVCGVLVISGAFLFLSAESLATFNHAIIRWMRLLHDVSGMALSGCVLGHIYFGVIPANWPELRAMFTGRVGNAGSRAKSV
jgi:cytochrome b subunit of formate dehydrogenase